MEHQVLPKTFEVCLMHARADRSMRAIIAQQLDDYGLTMMEWLALGVVSQAPNKGYSMSRIAASLDVTLPQVTALISSLVDKRFVKQKVLTTDKRGRQVIITNKGTRLILKLEQHIAAIIQTWSRDIPPNHFKAYQLTIAQLSLKS